MIFDPDSLVRYLAVILSSLLIVTFAFRRFIRSVFDPFFFNVVVYLSFCLAMMLSLPMKDITPHLTFVLYLSFFCFGFRFFHSRATRVESPRRESSFSPASIEQVRLITLTMVVITLCLAVYGFSQTGFALLSDDPSIEKTSGLSGGLGFIRRANWSLGSFSIVGLFFLVVVDVRRRTQYWLLIGLSAVLAILGGAKSALLPFLFLSYILTTHDMTRRLDTTRTFRIGLPLVAVMSLVMAILVLLIENGNVAIAFFRLVNRLLFSGDSLIYYYDSRVNPTLPHYDILGFLYSLVNSPLGMLRLVPYEYPLGYQMVVQLNGLSSSTSGVVGPNTPFFIVADLYFGPFLGLFYAFLIGYFVAFCQRLAMTSEASLLRTTLRVWLYLTSFTIILEIPLFIGKLFDFVIFGFPVFFLCLIFLELRSLHGSRSWLRSK